MSENPNRSWIVWLLVALVVIAADVVLITGSSGLI
jgi:hypothetical protein